MLALPRCLRASSRRTSSTICECVAPPRPGAAATCVLASRRPAPWRTASATRPHSASEPPAASRRHVALGGVRTEASNRISDSGAPKITGQPKTRAGSPSSSGPSQPFGGFCAETGGAAAFFVATALGIPVSSAPSPTRSADPAACTGHRCVDPVGVGVHVPAIGDHRRADLYVDSPGHRLSSPAAISFSRSKPSCRRRSRRSSRRRPRASGKSSR
jgi:hypothetical protein